MNRTTWLWLALVLAAPAAGEAQTRWDVAPFAGLFAGHGPAAPPGGGYSEEWFQTLQAGVVFGGYVTRHVKVAVEASGTTGGARYISRPVEVPGQPYPYWVSSELTTTVRSAAAVLAWQFRDNEWIHPFVEAGVSVDAEHSSLYEPELYLPGRGPGSPTRVPESDTLETTATDVRAVIGGGAKVYFRERAFVRTDARFTLSGDRQNLALRVGIGIDF